MSMDLTQLARTPEIVVEIGGRSYGFSELDVEALARLQSWVRANTPDPWEDARRRVKGLPDAVAAEILDRARKESLKWPPRIGTSAGTQALLGTEDGQVETFLEGLRVHYPDTQREDARTVYRTLNRDPDGEAIATRILSVLFGWRRPAEGVEPSPKK